MEKISTEEIDMAELKVEILDDIRIKGLPCNLSDRWLSLLKRDLTEALDHPEEPYFVRTTEALTAPMSVVMYLLMEKQNSQRLELSLDELHEYCQKYRMELELEQAKRDSGIERFLPATLDTILTNRAITN